MGRRQRYKKRTTIDQDPFGRKRIETEYVPTGCGMPGILGVGILVVLLFASRGC